MPAKKVLPISDPRVYATTHHSSLLAILFANPESYPWIYSNYIQQFTLKNLYESNRTGTLEFFIDHYGDYEVLEHRICPMIRFSRIPKEVAAALPGSTLDFLKQMISFGHYIYCTFDTYYIAAWRSGQHNPHMNLLYGFDDEDQVFYSGDNYSNGKYSFLQIPYAQVEASMNSYMNGGILDQSEGFELLQYRSPYDRPHYKGDPSKIVHSQEMLRLKLGKMIDDIRGFLLTPDQSYRIFAASAAESNELVLRLAQNHAAEPQIVRYEFLDSPLYAFGIAQYAVLREYVEAVITHADPYIDARAVSSVCDHKRLMLSRLAFINEYYPLPNYKELTDQNQSLYETASQIQSLCVKYNITKRPPILFKIQRFYEEMELRDRLFMEALASSLLSVLSR